MGIPLHNTPEKQGFRYREGRAPAGHSPWPIAGRAGIDRSLCFAVTRFRKSRVVFLSGMSSFIEEKHDTQFWVISRKSPSYG